MIFGYANFAGRLIDEGQIIDGYFSTLGLVAQFCQIAPVYMRGCQADMRYPASG